MKTISKLLLGVAFATMCSFSACQSNKNEESMIAGAASADTAAVLSEATEEGTLPKNRAFIRTANLRLQVKDVLKTTHELEKMVVKHGGFVTLTQLHNQTQQQHQIPIGADSLLQITAFQTTNDVTLRVPNEQLDTLLRQINSMATFWNERTIKAEEVSLGLLAKKIITERLKKYGNQLEKYVENRGKKLDETADAIASLQAGQAQFDDNKIQELSTQDQVNFSTVTIRFYQQAQLRNERIANVYELEERFTPTFGTELRAAFDDGFSGAKIVLLVLLRFWTLWLIGGIVYWLYRNRKSMAITR